MRRSPVVAFVALLLVIGGPLLVAPWFGWGHKPGGGGDAQRAQGRFADARLPTRCATRD